jgi:flavodoxin
MKILVTYYSDTGNTEKVAYAIKNSLDHILTDILPVADVQSVQEYDLIFCGFSVHAHSVPAKVEQFIKSIPGGKDVAFFATHGSLRGGPLAVTAFYHAIGCVHHGKVLGTFGCRGTVKMSLLDALSEKPEHSGWVKEARSAVGHPDDEDLADAKEWAKQMAGKSRAS